MVTAGNYCQGREKGSEENREGMGGFIPVETEECEYFLLEGGGVIPALGSAGFVV